MTQYQTALTLKSGNVKTGPIPVSTTSEKTCPDACPLRDSGCYANAHLLGYHWRQVTEKKRGGSWAAFCKAIAALPAGTFWRHNQAGDLPGDRHDIDGTALLELVRANTGKKGFTFTHYDVVANQANRVRVRAANNLGFTINLSANTLAHADDLAETGTGPVITILPAEVQGNQTLATPAGRTVVICPATYRDDVTCQSCQLCQHAGRKTIVGFPAHGSAKKRASTIARG